MMYKRNTPTNQNKKTERCSGIPPDEWLNNPKVQEAKKKHLKLLGLLEGEAEGLILDAGCGPGTYGIILANKHNLKVVGIDISKIAIRKARDRAFQKGNFHPVEGDLEFLPFKDAQFDIVFVGWTLHHFPSLESVCKELSRVLKSDGKITIVEPNEANLTMRASRFVENILSPLILKIGWDTPNRTTYTYKDYLREFQRHDFINLRYSSCYASLPPIPNSRHPVANVALGLIYHLRTFLFSLSTKLLSRPLNGPDLLMSAIKDKAR